MADRATLGEHSSDRDDEGIARVSPELEGTFGGENSPMLNSLGVKTAGQARHKGED